MWAEGRTHTHTHMTKLIVAWRNIANASKNKMVRTITVTYFTVCLTTQSTARIA